MTDRINHRNSVVLNRTSRRLIVLIPGLGSNSRNWASFRTRLETEAGYTPAEADWLPFDHGIRYSTLGRLNDLAHRLRNRIDGEWKEHGGYKDVVLIGHSFGGLIARKIYLLAAGAVPGEAPSAWGGHVSRLVLFAAVNRGFNLNRLNWIINVVASLARLFSRRIFYFEDVLQGSDFVTNLRIDWIRHFNTLQRPQEDTISDEQRIPVPLVVQFLGDEDGVLSREDSKDVLAFPNAHYIEVADASHSNLYRLEKEFAPDPNARYAVLREAFVRDPSNMHTDASFRPESSPVNKVVMILHGIRASNVDAWIDGLKSKLKARHQEDLQVVAPTYGYFSALRFALPAIRRRNIPIFRDLYTEQLAEHPDAEFNIIAHSNGTYMLGHSLERTPGMRFQNVVLAGSALPPEYKWAELMKPTLGGVPQVGRVLNERANGDVPIAILSSALRAFRMLDIGPGGFAGFHGVDVREVAYHEGGHSQALVTKNQQRLIDFALGGDPPDPGNLVEKPVFLGALSRAMPYLVWLVILGLVMAAYFYPERVFNPANIPWVLGGVIFLIVALDSG